MIYPAAETFSQILFVHRPYTIKISEMSSFSRDLKLSMRKGSSYVEQSVFLFGIFLLNAASTNSGFIPAFRHLEIIVMRLDHFLSTETGQHLQTLQTFIHSKVVGGLSLDEKIQ